MCSSQYYSSGKDIKTELNVFNETKDLMQKEYEAIKGTEKRIWKNNTFFA